MNILCISQVMPYSNVIHAGGKVFYNHILKLREYAEVDLLCYYDKGEEIYEEELKKICRKVELIDREVTKSNSLKKSVFQIKKYFTLLYNKHIILGYPTNFNEFTFRLKKIIQENQYDVIELSFTSSLTYLPIIRSIKPNIKINIIEHDVSFLNLERNYKYKKNLLNKFINFLRYKVYKYSEIKLLHKCDLITVLNDKDRRILLNEGFTNNQIYTEPPYFQRPNVIKDKSHKIKDSILFYGALWREENDESIYKFLVNIFPNLVKVKPNIKLYIVGNKPSKRVQNFSDDKNVFVTGFVEDPSEYFYNCEVFIAPLVLGAGIKIKTLEALAYGIPVISTYIGVEGIDIDNEKAFIIEDNFNLFGEKILELLDNEKARDQMSKNALEFINKNYDLNAAVSGLVDKYKSLK